jgi:hypothetical protein
MNKYTVEYRPVKRPKDKPWAVLMAAHPKSMVVARRERQDEAWIVADMLEGRGR